MDKNQAIELIRCSQISFQNLQKMNPILKDHPIFQIAMTQLDEGLKILDE